MPKPTHKFLVELDHEQVTYLCAALLGVTAMSDADQWRYAHAMDALSRLNPGIERDLLKRLVEVHNQMHASGTCPYED